MKFNKKVLEKLGLFFDKYDLHIVEQRNNYLKLQSYYFIAIISYNQFEHSTTLWIGSNDKQVEIDNLLLKSFFNSDLQLSNLPVEIFINNLALFFKNEAESLLTGDIIKLKELENFDLNRSEEYTNDLLYKQLLDIASNNWKNKDYKLFVETIDKIDINRVPESYTLKYKIAMRYV
jgi:hypothetical protein